MSTQSTPAKTPSKSAEQTPPVSVMNFVELGDHSIISKHLSNTVLSSHVKSKAMWREILKEIKTAPDDIDYTTHDIPLHLTNRIIQEEAEHMLGNQCSVMDCNEKSASICLSKLCEFFVLEMTMKAYHLHKDSSNTLSKKDILQVIEKTEIYDLFLEHLGGQNV